MNCLPAVVQTLNSALPGDFSSVTSYWLTIAIKLILCNLVRDKLQVWGF